MRYDIRKSGENDKLQEPFFQNNIWIKGVVDSTYDSGDHCFGIIYMKNFESNVKEFDPYKEYIYSYAIQNEKCEIYSWVCLHGVKKGDSVILDSNKRTVCVKTKDTTDNTEGGLSFVDNKFREIAEYTKLSFKDYKNRIRP